MPEFKDLLRQEFSPYGTLSDQQLSQCEAHFELLLKWNRKLNLTRITDTLEAVRFHYCESLYLARFLPENTLRIADVGTGAGFPGIPLAIIRPDCHVDLIESDQRKAVFLREATRALPNTTVVARRAEEVAEQYNWLVSRAVSLEFLSKLNLAPALAFLGAEGTKLPWGEDRAVLIRHSK